MDPWRVLRPGATHAEQVATRALVERMEEQDAALAVAQADLTARRVVEGLVDLLAVLGLVERKKGVPGADR